MESPPHLRCVVLQVINPHLSHTDPDLAAKKFRELEQLVKTVGGEVVESATQHKVLPNPSTYIGGGKVEWLKQVVEAEKIDVVILNNLAKPSQIFRLEKILWEVNPKIMVWDRVDLILKIFDLHAHTAEAKLQIQLARIQHLGPRIYGLGGTVLSKQGAGIGTKGLGESNSELEKRKMKLLKQHIQKELAALNSTHLHQIHQRREQGTKTAALVGYTSAGKTTLFNALTGKQRQTDQSLFTTLDSVVGRIKLENGSEGSLVSDTIGFIEDLPPQLVQAFRTSLLESLEAQTILHVMDAADPYLDSKFKVVEDILGELGVSQQPILVLNKADLLSNDQKNAVRQKFPSRKILFISAATGQNLEELKALLR